MTINDFKILVIDKIISLWKKKVGSVEIRYFKYPIWNGSLYRSKLDI
jgi:hypothetical protein